MEKMTVLTTPIMQHRQYVLIVSGENDSHIQPVIKYLVEFGLTPVILSPHYFFSKKSFNFLLNSKSPCLEFEELSIPIAQLKAVWVRKPYSTYQGEDVSKKVVWKETQSLIKQLPGAISQIDPEVLILNEFFSSITQSQKLRQLVLASQLNLVIPDTAVTNSTDALEKFRYSKKQGLIVKTFESGMVEVGIERYFMNTTLVPKDLSSVSVELSPHLYQENIIKKLEFRITYINGKFISVAFDASVMPKAKIDWRAAKANINKIPHVIHPLPEDIESKLRKMIGTLDLKFCTIDMALTPEDEYVFFEINPNGQYLWLESVVDVDISREMANFLAQGK